MGLFALARKGLTVNKATQAPVRADPPTPSTHYDPTHEFPNLQAHVNLKESDGAFWCCICEAENEVCHWTGPYPLGEAKCHCGHVLCSQCLSTQLIHVQSQTNESMITAPMKPQNREVPYGQICECGLSHRAKSVKIANGERQIDFRITCRCGRVNSETWLRFRIGSNKSWRLHSDKWFQRGVEWRLHRHVYGKSQAQASQDPKSTPITPLPLAYRDADGYFLDMARPAATRPVTRATSRPTPQPTLQPTPHAATQTATQPHLGRLCDERRQNSGISVAQGADRAGVERWRQDVHPRRLDDAPIYRLGAVHRPPKDRPPRPSLRRRDREVSEEAAQGLVRKK